jgi:ribosomal protein S8
MFILYNQMLANLKGALKKKNLETTIYYNKLCFDVLNKLKNFGYILGFQIISSKKLKIYLKYVHNKSIINNIIQYTSSKKKYYKTFL